MKTRFIYLFLIILCCFPATLHAQESENPQFMKARQAYKSKNLSEAWKHFLELRAQGKLTPKEKVDVRLYLGRLTTKLGFGLDSARFFSQEAIELCHQLDLLEDKLYFVSVRDHARAFSKEKKTDSALYYMHRALPHLSDKIEVNEQVFFYHQLFFLYYYKHELWMARDYLLKAEEVIKDQSLPPHHLVRHLHNKVYMYQSIKAFDLARKDYQRLLQLIPNLPHYHKGGGYSKAYLHKTIADLYLNSAHYDSAVYHGQKALHHFHLSSQQDTTFQANTTLTMARAAEGMKNWLQAAEWYQTTLKLLKNSQQELPFSFQIRALRGMAQLNRHQEAFQQALDYLNEAEQVYTENFRLTYRDNVPKDDSKMQLMHIKWDKGKVLQQNYQTHQDPELLKQAAQYYMQAVRLMVILRQESFSDQDKIQHIEYYYPLYQEALACIYKLYEVNPQPAVLFRAFEIIENSQSALLSDYRKLQTAKPSQLLQQEDSLQKERSNLLAVSDSLSEEVLKENLSDINIQLRQLNWQFTDQFIQTDLKTQKLIPQIQQRLASESALYLSYFISSDHLYIFLLNEQEILFKKIAVGKEFFDNLQAFKNTLYGPQAGKSLRFAGRQEAFKLYQKLIAPIDEYLQDQELLIISRTGEMNYIPFDALLNKPGADAEFLIENYRLHYVFSAQDWYNTSAKENPREAYDILAMAPYSEYGKKTLNTQLIAPRQSEQLTLPASTQEVQAISPKPRTGPQATKQYFVRNSEQYQIIHLATHAKADPANPLNSYILFYPEDTVNGYKLYSHEIMNLELPQVKLVALSACQTGDGKLQKGEGLMSLARSFAFAGVSNIIMSLWNADDEATAYILQRFYNYLREGKGKASALQQAKLDYIHNQKFQLQSQNPFFWANLQLIGSDAKLYPAKQLPYTALRLGLLALALLTTMFLLGRYFYLRKHSKQSA